MHVSSGPLVYSRFSHYVAAAIFVARPLGSELFSYAIFFFCLVQNKYGVSHASENQEFVTSPFLIYLYHIIEITYALMRSSDGLQATAAQIENEDEARLKMANFMCTLINMRE